MSKIKLTIVILWSLLNTQALKAQDEDKTVTLVVNGQGKTLDEAKQNALRSAIEQAFGAFISSKTEILNDQVVSDQITSVSSGNIQSYETLNEAQFPNNTWTVTLKAIVSVKNLTSFVQTKGVEVTVKGGLFTLNVKQQLLNEQGEFNAICEMIGVLHEPMQSAFDFVLQTGEPKSIDTESQNWEIPIEVSVVANKNLNTCMDYLKNTIASIALSEVELDNYKKLGKEVFNLTISNRNSEITYYLRKSRSMEALMSFLNNWKFYTTNFNITDGINNFDINNTNMNRKNCYKTPNLNKLSIQREKIMFFGVFVENGLNEIVDYEYFKNQKLKLCWEGLFEESSIKKPYEVSVFTYEIDDTLATLTFKDKKKLVEIEKLDKYAINSKGVVSEFKNGGYVVFQDSGHGFVASILDYKDRFEEGICFPVENEEENLKTQNQIYLDSILNSININGYSDWELPTMEEFEKISNKLIVKDISFFRLNGGGV